MSQIETDREAIMQALLARVTGAPVAVSFAADTVANSAQLANVTPGAQLFKGLPVFGIGIPLGAVIADPDAQTLSLPAAATASQVALQQGVQTSGRRLVHWSKVAAQPALFIDDGDEIHPDRPSGINDKLTLEAEIWLYANGGQNPDAVPASQLNALIAAVATALAPTAVFNGRSVQNVQTLGLVQVEHCRIEGRLIKYSGHLGGQARAVVPVKILVAQ